MKTHHFVLVLLGIVWFVMKFAGYSTNDFGVLIGFLVIGFYIYLGYFTDEGAPYYSFNIIFGGGAFGAFVGLVIWTGTYPVSPWIIPKSALGWVGVFGVLRYLQELKKQTQDAPPY